MAKKLNEGKTKPPKPVEEGKSRKEKLSKTKPPRTDKKK